MVFFFLFNKEKEKEEKEMKKLWLSHSTTEFLSASKQLLYSIYLKFLFWTGYICNRSVLNIRNTIEYILGIDVLVILI